jgi:hypothetical protein
MLTSALGDIATMADETPPESSDTEPSSNVNFGAFVVSLAHTAAVHFGDVPDPSSGQKLELNLAGARQMIDILSLLEEKTRGNLSAEERQLIEQLLYELRLRFVEAEKKPKSSIILP